MIRSLCRLLFKKSLGAVSHAWLACSLLAAVAAHSKSEWKPLFNGKSFQPEWHFVGDSTFWTIDPKDTSIVGFSSSKSTPHSLLFTNKVYDEFTVKYAYRLKAGCSGFWFRSHDKGTPTTVDGPQIEAKREGAELLEVGSIYVWPQPGWALQHSRAFSLKTAPRPDDYQEVVLTVKKPNVYVNVNGVQAVGETDPALISAGAKAAWNYTAGQYSREPGQLGLQVHEGYEIDIRFKHIAILAGCNDPASPDYGGATVAGMPKQPAVYQDDGSCNGTAVSAPGVTSLERSLGKVRRLGGIARLEVSHPGAHSLEILSLDGRIRFAASAPGAHDHALALKPGLYLARLTAGSRTVSRKLLVP